MKTKSYKIVGTFVNPDLPIDMLIDIDELIYYKRIEAIRIDKNIPTFKAMDLERIAILIYKEYILAKKLVLSNQAFAINNFKHLRDKKEYFLKVKPIYSQNNIINNFLAEEYNLNVFVLALFGEKELKDLLNEIFKKFYFEYRFIAYLSKILYFEAVNFDKKMRSKMEREPIILNMLIDKERDLTLLDTLSSMEQKFELNSDKLEDCIIDEQLYSAYKKLVKKQQQILYLTYYTLLKDAEIAKKLNVTKQAVSKNRIKALNIIRKSLRREGDE